MPSQPELEKLSIRAAIAYAAKCARRMQPMYDLPPDTPNRDDLVTAVNQAITVAEQYSTGEIRLPASQSTVRFDYKYEVEKFAQQTAEAAQKAAGVASGTARDAANLAAITVKAIVDIVYVSVKEDPNAAWMYDEAIKDHSWDIAQDIIAEETKHTRAAREAEAEARRRTLAIEAIREVIRIASNHIEKDLLVSDYQFVMEHLQS